MIEGVHYENSYSPTCQGFSFRMSMAYAATLMMVLYFIDASNAFQTNVIDNPIRRHYLGIPFKYLDWYANRWPGHPLLQYTAQELVMQTLRDLQGTKDAGNHWYMLLVKIFRDLGMKPNSVCRGIWHWHHKEGEAILCLATDDMLLGSTNVKLYELLLVEF